MSRIETATGSIVIDANGTHHLNLEYRIAQYARDVPCGFDTDLTQTRP